MSERASQFMPFAALRGYYDIIELKHSVEEDRKILSESAQEELSQCIAQLKQGEYVRVTYYTGKVYKSIEGSVERIDFSGKVMEITDNVICFEDIADIVV